MTRRYLLDTGPTADFLFKRQGMTDRFREVRKTGARVGICMPVYGEIAAGLDGSDDPERYWPTANARIGLLTFWPYEKHAARKFGEIAAYLRRTGQIIQQIDMQVAAIALTLGDCAVVTGDGDFRRVPGLTVENWAA
jgi:tRNA(fMet)-specific endonuclease VapC